MADEKSAIDVRDLWQSQSAEGYQMSTDEIRRRIEEMERKTKRATYDFYLASALIAIVVLWLAWAHDNPLQRIGAVLAIVGFGLLMFQVRRERLATAGMAGELGAASIDFYRAQLVRRREFCSGARLWPRLLVLVPGPLLFFFGFAQARPDLATMIYVQIATFIIAVAAVFPVNRRAAAKLQRQIDDLDRLQKG